MSNRIRPAASATTFYLDDSCLVYLEAQTRLFRMNMSSGLVWALLEEGCSRDELIAQVRQMGALPQARAEELVAACLAEWSDKQLLHAQDRVRADELAVAAETSAPTPRDVPGAHGYRVLDRTIRVEPGVPELADIYHPALAHLEHDGAPDCIIRLHVTGAGRIAVDRDDAPVTTLGPDELAPFIKGLVWSSAINQSDDVIGFHAGVVAGRAGAILMPGPPGSGKSTLTAGLIARGYRYLSDELAVLTPQFSIRPLPLALCVKTGGRHALQDLYPTLASLPVFDRSDGKSVSYLPPPRSGDGGPAPLAGLVFPTFDPHRSTEMTAVPPSECLERLMSQCMVVRGHLRAERMRALLDLLSRLPAYRLVFSDRNVALDLVGELFPPGYSVAPARSKHSVKHRS